VVGSPPERPRVGPREGAGRGPVGTSPAGRAPVAQGRPHAGVVPPRTAVPSRARVGTSQPPPSLSAEFRPLGPPPYTTLEPGPATTLASLTAAARAAPRQPPAAPTTLGHTPRRVPLARRPGGERGPPCRRGLDARHVAVEAERAALPRKTHRGSFPSANRPQLLVLRPALQPTAASPACDRAATTVKPLPRLPPRAPASGRRCRGPGWPPGFRGRRAAWNWGLLSLPSPGLLGRRAAGGRPCR
jgi:hypothetical protein